MLEATATGRLGRRSDERAWARSDPRRARELVLAHGWNSTSHQVLDPGMRHWFSPEGDAVVGYVERFGVRVVAGAPVAADDRLAAVTAAFEDASRAAGRQVCYFAAEDRLLALLERGRHTSHLIGLQPIWSAPTWAERFDSSASLRSQRRRALNKGVRVDERPPNAEAGAELRACHAAWLRAKGLPRLRFLAHSDLEGADPHVVADRRLFVASFAEMAAAGGADVLGYLTAAPVPRRRGWLVDKIVRHPAAPNGTAELLLDTAMRRLAGESERFTLGLAPLAPPAPTTAGYGAGWLARAERLAVRHGKRLYDFEGLYAFKSKFRPDAWEPVYLVSADESLTPAALVALAGVFLGRRPACAPAACRRRSAA